MNIFNKDSNIENEYIRDRDVCIIKISSLAGFTKTTMFNPILRI